MYNAVDYKKRRYRRRQIALGYLGGICTKCGSAERLEFDHVDPSTVEFRITEKLTAAWPNLLVELNKCQLLCHDCHMDKTLAERGYVRSNHGMVGMYSNHQCRCELCTEAWRVYIARRRAAQAS